jgi:hypothetical protein
LGASREQALLRQCELALSRWQAQWWSEDDRRRPSLRFAESIRREQRMHWLRCRDSACELTMGFAVEGLELELGARALSIARHAAEAQFCGAVGTACLHSLAQQLLAGDEVQPEFNKSTETPSWTATRFGGLSLVLEGLPQKVWMHFNRAWCERHAPATLPIAAPLISRLTAIAATRVQVDARIELGKVALSESVGWRPGEVLITDESRAARTHLSVNGKALAQGRLARAAEGTRAVAIS